MSLRPPTDRMLVSVVQKSGFTYLEADRRSQVRDSINTDIIRLAKKEGSSRAGRCTPVELDVSLLRCLQLRESWDTIHPELAGNPLDVATNLCSKWVGPQIPGTTHMLVCVATSNNFLCLRFGPVTGKLFLLPIPKDL